MKRTAVSFAIVRVLALVAVTPFAVTALLIVGVWLHAHSK